MRQIFARAHFQEGLVSPRCPLFLDSTPESENLEIVRQFVASITAVLISSTSDDKSIGARVLVLLKRCEESEFEDSELESAIEEDPAIVR